jgi:hypothetical protein
MRKHKFSGSVACLLLILGLALSVSAQQPAASNADWQFWPEVDLSIKISQRVSLLSVGTLHFGKSVSDLNDEEAGIGVSFALNRYFSLSSAYRYVTQQPPDRSHTREHRFYLDFAARVPLRDKFVLIDRNRVELRRIDRVDSRRYRNRLQLERSASIGDRKITPYLAGEMFYDDRYHIWNRSRISGGVRVPVSNHLTIDGYYLEQFDVRDRPFERRHVIGMNLRVDY